MAVDSNLSGAIIFWSYIVAALTSAGFTIDAILHLPKATSQAQAKHVRLFSLLALLSFATLSFNMLNVLAQSFQLWLEQHEKIEIMDLSGFLRTIWHWSVTSMLFQDFGEAIVENQFRFIWIQSALFVTFSVCLYMGSEGGRMRVPRLWAFFALSQILPISFAQNLFYIAVMRSSRQKQRQPVTTSLWLTGLVTMAYVAVTNAAYNAADSDAWHPFSLMTTILVARLLLIFPFVLPQRSTMDTSKGSEPSASNSAQSLVLAVAVGSLGYHLYGLRNNPDCWSELAKAPFSHPAVSSLGVDFLMSGLSFAIWTFTAGRSEFE